MTESQDKLAGIIKFHLSSSEGELKLMNFRILVSWPKHVGKERNIDFRNKAKRLPLEHSSHSVRTDTVNEARVRQM